MDPQLKSISNKDLRSQCNTRAEKNQSGEMKSPWTERGKMQERNHESSKIRHRSTERFEQKIDGWVKILQQIEEGKGRRSILDNHLAIAPQAQSTSQEKGSEERGNVMFQKAGRSSSFAFVYFSFFILGE